MNFSRAHWLTIALNLTLSLPLVSAQDSTPYLPVGTAKTKKTVIAIAPFKTADGATAQQSSEKIQKTLSNDLAYVDMFKLLPPSAFIENKEAGIQPGTFKASDWSSIGAEFVVKASLKAEGSATTFEGYLYDASNGKQVAGKRYVAEAKDAEIVGHRFANEIVEALTGLPGIFTTKIAMSCDRTGKKEVYVMDFDGTNVRKITNHRSIAFAPAWSPDGNKLAYSLYVKHKGNNKNIDLYEFDFATSTIKLLSNRTGINSGAVYHPKGGKLALTMSFLGNPEIFVLDPSSGNATRVTSSFGFDVDPSFSPDGSKIAFVSSRSGKPMVHSMNADGTAVNRLTYAGRYNATPSWSPRNNKIAFAGWIDSRFDIFIMNPDGTNIERLTKNQGNNEDPTFSPDGQFIAFSSNRAGQKSIYVMNIDGTFVKRLTFGMGNCVGPKWSSPLKTTN